MFLSERITPNCDEIVPAKTNDLEHSQYYIFIKEC